MAVYMVSYHYPGENRNEAIQRFMEGSALEPPAGVKNLARWHSVDGAGGWGIVEASDPKDIADWVMSWSDLIDYEVTPVITDEEFGALCKKHNLG